LLLASIPSSRTAAIGRPTESDCRAAGFARRSGYCALTNTRVRWIRSSSLAFVIIATRGSNPDVARRDLLPLIRPDAKDPGDDDPILLWRPFVFPEMTRIPFFRGPATNAIAHCDFRDTEVPIRPLERLSFFVDASKHPFPRCARSNTPCPPTTQLFRPAACRGNRTAELHEHRRRGWQVARRLAGGEGSSPRHGLRTADSCGIAPPSVGRRARVFPTTILRPTASHLRRARRVYRRCRRGIFPSKCPYGRCDGEVTRESRV